MRYGGADQVSLLLEGYEALTKQIEWFNVNRKAEPEGYYYTDIYKKIWESGVDDGIRFDQAQNRPSACVDATSHIYIVYWYAAAWAERLEKKEEAEHFRSRARELEVYIQKTMFDEDTVFFHDSWSAGRPALRKLAIEGIWPVVAFAVCGKDPPGTA